MYTSFVASSRFSANLDWPVVLGTFGPLPVGAGVAYFARHSESEAFLGVFIGTFLIYLPLSAAVSYWVSCRVADRWGQPWAYLSFFAALAGWLGGGWLFLAFSGALEK